MWKSRTTFVIIFLTFLLSTLLFILVHVLETLSHKLRTGVPWQLLYAGGLALISGPLEECISKLKAWNTGMESKGFHVNMKKTKFLGPAILTHVSQQGSPCHWQINDSSERQGHHAQCGGNCLLPGWYAECPWGLRQSLPADIWWWWKWCNFIMLTNNFVFPNAHPIYE